MLDIQDLTIAYEQNGTLLTAVRGFSLSLAAGHTYGLVGESGSGKSTVAMAIMGYPGAGGRVTSGRIEFEGLDLLALPNNELAKILGKEITLVPQDPMSSLNPSIRIGEQIAEGLRHHLSLSKEHAAKRAIELLKMVRVPDPARVARSYAHEISGGMQQRVLIAMAMSAEPKLIILDEPTTSLDVTTQAAVLDLLRDLIRDRQTTLLYITHNLGVVAQICDRVAVLYAGELVEDAATELLYRSPLHPYTKGLLESVPRLGQNKSENRLTTISGTIPSLSERSSDGYASSCVFAPRCPLALDICYAERPLLEPATPDWRVRCHRWLEIAAGELEYEARDATTPQGSGPVNGNGEILLDVRDVRVEYPVSRPILDVALGNPAHTIKAVDDVSLSIQRGRTLGLVGESGSGKTTLARAIVGLVARTDGEIKVSGLSLPPRLSDRDLETLRLVQFIFQNPEEALNPYLTIGETLQRPFVTLGKKSNADARDGARKLLAAVGLPIEYMERLPGQLSGGEKQRIAIARAFATDPSLLIADEPVSSLDVSVQAAILNLMEQLQLANDSTMLFISHDLAVVGYLADRIAVIYAGQIMEMADADELFTPPHHPYTEALLSAVPDIHLHVDNKSIRLEGDVPSQIEVPSGCRFHPRCPRFLGEICVNEVPPWQQTQDGKWILCHIPVADLVSSQVHILQYGGEGQ